VIEAAVSFGLIALGGSVWLGARIARRVYRDCGHERDSSFLARLFANDGEGNKGP
jgi:hypothetical protein